MKVLIIGDWHSDLHEEEMYRSLIRLGHDVMPFKWWAYFKNEAGLFNLLSRLKKRLENKFLLGPIIQRINHDLIRCAAEYQPKIIFIYRGTHVFPKALKEIKAILPKCQLIGYNNDDPFSPLQSKYYWRHFIAGIPLYDLMLAYRHHNIRDFLNAGARRVELLRSWYVPDRNFPIDIAIQDVSHYESDVVFAGHYESDQRLRYLEAIVKQGICLKIFGPPETWEKVIRQTTVLKSMAPIQRVWGAEYNKALCASKIALCFFSKLNRDTYTRRCFEIPATGTMMLSEYSDDLAGLFKEGVEADYFRSESEMLEKIIFYLKNHDARKNVAAAGLLKVKTAGHDIDSRLKVFFN